MSTTKLFQHTAFILALSLVVGLAVNMSLIRRQWQGEFAQGFLTSEESSAIIFITLAEAEELFSQQAAVFIDSREEEDYQAGHIFGAVNVPFTGETRSDRLEELPFVPESLLVIYCDGSECRSSVELGKVLFARGYSNIRVFFGGWNEWLAADLPVIREDGDDRQ